MNEILTNVVNKAIATLDHIKSAIIRNGVDVPEGSSTATYADKISEVFDAGIDSVAPDIEEQTTRLNDGLTGGNSDAQTMREKIYEAGEAEGFEAGKNELLDTMWEYIQNGGYRTDYGTAFLYYPDEVFYPKYDLTAYICNRMFSYAKIPHLKQRFESQGVILDTSKATNLTQLFQDANIEETPFIDASNANIGANYMYGSSKIKYAHVKLNPNRGWPYMFIDATGLETLIIEGGIQTNDFDVHWCPLNKTSLTGIVNALSTTTTGLTVTLRLDAVNKAFETSEGAMDGSTSDEWLTLAATKSNWTISLINS